ncbi:MAG: NAD(P)/FAD-dependent oxidoreductase [Clostridia bacterium]|nr:NAD(P)/FAD-dependent oxidoreductase [Clostridia bacterium]MDD4799115.1 NAD(P)/FAD-dependent oxidoreductase [Clostridia bacterium]
MYDIVIIGAGVVGGFVARQLSRYRLKIALIEKHDDVCFETSRANSAIIHAGYNGHPGSIKAVLTKAANEDFHNVCAQLDVEFERLGALIIAVDDEGKQKILEKYAKGQQNGIKGLELLTGKQALAMEPNLNPRVIYAMYSPTVGVVNPWEFGLAACENAVDNGVELHLSTKVLDLKRQADGYYAVKTNKGEFIAKYVINCAGIYSDEINNLVAKPFFRIAPRRGEYFVLDKEARSFVNHVVFEARADDDVKGVIIIPTVHGNVLVGPSTQDDIDKDDVKTTAEHLQAVKRVAAQSMVNIPFDLTIRTFAGIRPRPQMGKLNQKTGEWEYGEDKVKDFILGEPEGVENFINCAGIKSPGLTCANEIGKYILHIIEEKEGANLIPNPDFSPCRRPLTRFSKRTDEEKASLIKENPAFGNVVCRCGEITEAEIVDVIQRNCGARSLDGVKRRAGTSLGRCQGGFCTPLVVEILERELKRGPEQITKDEAGSNIVTDTLL